MASSVNVVVHRGVLVAGAIGLLGLGAAGAYLFVRQSSESSARSQPGAGSAVSAAAVARTNEASLPVTITLTKDAAERAGITLVAVAVSSRATTLRIPGIVQPNAYKTITVTPLTSGRVTRVAVELGQPVQRGQVLAEIYSPELVDVRTQYLSARAALDAHELALRRTEKLVEIGAASRQELEMIHAEHTAATTAVDSHRARLALLGISDQDLSVVSAGSEGAATFRVVAPASGIVTARSANVGLNVDPSMALVTVADLSDVWVVGEVYERDFPAVAVGTSAAVTFPAYPELHLTGRVAYIDPQVKPETRTAQVRVEVPNAGRRLRLGMLAQIGLSTTNRLQTMTIPRDAVQRIGSRTVVYVSNPLDPTQFTEREVVMGESVGDSVQLASGVAPGDLVVSKGSFSLRAERERLGPSSPQPPVAVVR